MLKGENLKYISTQLGTARSAQRLTATAICSTTSGAPPPRASRSVWHRRHPEQGGLQVRGRP